MSNDTPIPSTTKKRRSPVRAAPNESLLMLLVVAAFFGLWTIQFENLTGIGLMILAVFFAIGVGLKRGWAIYLMFGCLVFLKFDEFGPQTRIRPSAIQWNDLLFTVVSIVFAALCLRYLETAKYARIYYPQGAVPKSKVKRQSQFPSLLGGRWWLIPVSVLMAVCLLWAFPYDSTLAYEFWITPTGTRVILLTFFLFFVWFVCRSLISALLRWNIEPEQANIQARSLIAKEYWIEVSAFEKRLAKLKMRDGAD